MNPVKYAEDELGVHDVQTRAERALKDFGEWSIAEADHAARVRDCKDDVDDHQAVATAEQRGKHADLSNADFDRSLRRFLATDVGLAELRSKLRKAQHDHDEATAERRHAEHTIEALAARMIELGGLLNFYAAVKAAGSQPPQATQAKEPTQA